jgi:hypothetical protein
MTFNESFQIRLAAKPSMTFNESVQIRLAAKPSMTFNAVFGQHIFVGNMLSADGGLFPRRTPRGRL